MKLVRIDASLVAARVREVRDHLKQTQADLAASLGISQSSLTHYETGRRPLPVEVAAKLAHASGFRLDWLYGLRDNKR